MASKNYSMLRLQTLAVAAASAFLCLPQLPAQSSSSGHLSLGDVPKVIAKRNEAVTVKLPVKIQPGFHVNSNTPSEDYLIPLRVTWTELGALQGGTIIYPKPVMEKYEFAPKPLSVFTGNFDLVANFKIAPTAQAGPGMAVGRLRYQACNNRACFPPKTLEVRVPYQIQ